MFYTTSYILAKISKGSVRLEFKKRLVKLKIEKELSVSYDFEMIIRKSYLERKFCVITLQGA